MFRHISSSLHRNAALSFRRVRATPVTFQSANLGTAEKKGSIIDAWNKSCYHEMDFTIPETSTVYEAVEKFSAYDVGALVTVDEAGESFVGLHALHGSLRKIIGWMHLNLTRI
jgi:predicted transcriptional regulator